MDDKKNGIEFPVVSSNSFGGVEFLDGAQNVTSKGLDWGTAARMIFAYMNHGKRLKKTYQKGNGTTQTQTLLGFRFGVKELDILLKRNPDEIMVSFAVSKDCLLVTPNSQDDQRGITIIVSAIKHEPGSNCGKLIFGDDSAAAVLEYCDPCPPKCPTNFAMELNMGLGGGFVHPDDLPCCIDCKPDSPCA